MEWPTPEDAKTHASAFIRDQSLADLMALAVFVDNSDDVDFYELICDRIVELDPTAFEDAEVS